MCVLSLCVCVKFVCVKFCMCKEAGGGGGEGARDTESKTRTPHKDAGKKTCSSEMLGGQGADFLRGVAFWSIRSSGLLR